MICIYINDWHREYDHDDSDDGDGFLMKDSARQGDKREQLVQELRMREQELEFTLTKQREVNRSSLFQLCYSSMPNSYSITISTWDLAGD